LRVAAGQPCGVDVLERSSTSTRDEDALEKEIATWAQTQGECDAVVQQREQALILAEMNAEAEARAAIGNSGALKQLLDGFTDLRDAYERRLAVLKYLSFANCIADAGKPAIEAAIRPSLLDHYHPACAEWRRALEALTRDHDAALPGIK